MKETVVWNGMGVRKCVVRVIGEERPRQGPRRTTACDATSDNRHFLSAVFHFSTEILIQKKTYAPFVCFHQRSPFPFSLQPLTVCYFPLSLSLSLSLSIFLSLSLLPSPAAEAARHSAYDVEKKGQDEAERPREMEEELKHAHYLPDISSLLPLHAVAWRPSLVHSQREREKERETREEKMTFDNIPDITRLFLYPGYNIGWQKRPATRELIWVFSCGWVESEREKRERGKECATERKQGSHCEEGRKKREKVSASLSTLNTKKIIENGRLPSADADARTPGHWDGNRRSGRGESGRGRGIVPSHRDVR